MLSFQSHIPGPKICIVANVHGNEPVGIRIFEHLLAEGIEKKIQKWGIHFLIANTEARAAYLASNDPLSHRFLDHDLNRIWNTDFIQGSREYVRREEMKELLLQSDIILDIHSVSNGDDLLGIADKNSRIHAEKFMDVENILIQDIHSSSMTSWCSRQGKISFGIEAGNHISESWFSNGLRNVKNMLSYFGLMDGEVLKSVPYMGGFEFLTEIKVTEDNFWYNQPYCGFTKIFPGEDFAHDGNRILRNENTFEVYLGLVRKKPKKWDGAGFLFRKI